MRNPFYFERQEYSCNCRNKESCPLQSQCLTTKVIYEATVVNASDDEYGHNLALQIQHLRNDIATIHEIQTLL